MMSFCCNFLWTATKMRHIRAIAPQLTPFIYHGCHFLWDNSVIWSCRPEAPQVGQFSSLRSYSLTMASVSHDCRHVCCWSVLDVSSIAAQWKRQDVAVDISLGVWHHPPSCVGHSHDICLSNQSNLRLLYWKKCHRQAKETQSQEPWLEECNHEALLDSWHLKNQYLGPCHPATQFERTDSRHIMRY